MYSTKTNKTMSTNNQINIDLPSDIVQNAIAVIQDSRKALALYLQALTPEQRQTIFKMGDKTVATVSKVKGYLTTNPEFTPKYMDDLEFNKDEDVVAQLTPLANLLKQLHSDIEDTIMLAGSEALVASMLYYGSVKEAALKGVPTAKPIYEDLQARFSKSKQSKPLEP